MTSCSYQPTNILLNLDAAKVAKYMYIDIKMVPYKMTRRGHKKWN
jgi:hypothetical protein